MLMLTPGRTWRCRKAETGQERTIADGSYPVPLVSSASLAQLVARIPELER
jgi:hypothetical protein